MKAMVRLTVFVLLLGVVPAASYGVGYLEFAEPNTIGFYFDDGDWSNEAHVETLQVVTGYVVLAAATEPELTGYQFGLAYEGPLVNSRESLYGDGAVNVSLVEDDYNVSLAAPLPTAAPAILVAIDLFIVNSNPGSIYGKAQVDGDGCRFGFTGPSGFVPCEWSTCPIPMADGPHCSDENCRSVFPLAVINGQAPVATDRTSWSAVKAMYGDF